MALVRCRASLSVSSWIFGAGVVGRPKDLGGSGRIDPIGVAILGVGSFAWACGSIYAKHGRMPTSPLLGSAMQSLTGGVILWIVARFDGRDSGAASGSGFDAVVDRGHVSGLLRLDDWVFIVSLHFEAQHGDAGRDVCVRESDRGVVSGMVPSPRGDYSADDAGVGGDSCGGLLVITAPHRGQPKTADGSRTEILEATEDPAF